VPSERFLEAVEEYVERVGGKTAYHARRLKCQTDLWFLSKEIFGRDLFERTHRPVIDFFLKKKPYAPAFRKDSRYGLAEFHEAIASLETLNRRKGICLYPRGSYKSTEDSDDAVQYIICYPDIRIEFMVGESSLGEAFVPEIKKRFVLEKDAHPTEFQLLFPEFVIDLETDKDQGGAQEYWCPARRITQISPTLGSISILGSTSGWHCDVLKCDDVITDTTPVETALARNKVVRKFVTTANMLDPHGVLELIGTRYHEEDLYAHVRDVLKNCRYLCGASWTVLPHAGNKKLRDLLETDVVLLFPERQGYAFLHEKLLLDEQTFCLQQLNAPQLTGLSVKFRIEDLRAATTRVPQNPTFKRYNFWDVATTDSEGSDYTAGGFVSIDTAKWIAYLHVFIMDKFTPSELAFQIAKLAKETQPERVFFEKYKDTAELWLEQEVRKIGVNMGYEIPIHAFKTDKTKMAKGHRICGLEPLITGGRLFFSNLIPNLEALFKQFTEFKGVPHQKRHDDGPDMLSMLRMVMPMTGLDMPKAPEPGINLGLQVLTNAKENAAWQEAQRKDAAVQAFIRGTSIPPAIVMAPPKQEGYFPGQ
jgi:predicted phage terminase large subunit-like protein